jgi:hypothetical protein
MPPNRSLVVLGCSATKLAVQGNVPAVHLYDGPFYRVLRSHLRDYEWSEGLSVGILSARHGLIGGLAPIAHYDQQMTSCRALQLQEPVSDALRTLASTHTDVHLLLGKKYLQAVNLPELQRIAPIHIETGAIGMKLHRFSRLLEDNADRPRTPKTVGAASGLLYFLPDWDDFVDRDYDFRRDTFSAKHRSARTEIHVSSLCYPQRLCNGILVSLAQHLGGGKGFLKRVPLTSPTLLRPRSLRSHFGLSPDQAVFGDCGAFSYSGEPAPTITVDEAIALYDLYGFDLGASVDHIPLEEIVDPAGKRVMLPLVTRKARVRLTRDNAEVFIENCRLRRATFTPVGIIQGIEPADYSRQLPEYMEMGYRHLALGGLVPRSDAEISDV